MGAFLQELDKLYYLDHFSASSPADLLSELENVKYGFVSERLAKKIWTGPVINGLTAYKFCLKALEAMGIIVPFKTSLLPEPFLENLSMDEVCYFMPSVRTDYGDVSGALDLDPESLYVIHETDNIPFHKLAQFVVYLQERHHDRVTFIPTTCYSTVHFEWRLISKSVSTYQLPQKFGFEDGAKGEEEALKITIVFYKDVVQIKLHCADHLIESNTEAVDYLRSVLKMACVHVFHQTSSRLAAVCPNKLQSSSPVKPHLLVFRISESNFQSIYCDLCKARINNDDSFDGSVWVRADYRGPNVHAVYHNGEHVYTHTPCLCVNVMYGKNKIEFQCLISTSPFLYYVETLNSERLMKIARHLAREPSVFLSELAVGLGQSEEVCLFVSFYEYRCILYIPYSAKISHV